MGNIDSVPVLSQVKSVVQGLSGDDAGAARTADNFFDNCLVVSQTKSFVQFCAGDEKGARETQMKFLKDVEKLGGVGLGVASVTVGVLLTPVAGPVGTSLIGAGAGGVISVYSTSNDEEMNWKKFGKHAATGALSGAVPVAGEVAAQTLDNHFEGRPLDQDLGKAAAVGFVSWGIGSGLGAAGKSAANAAKKKVVNAAGEKILDSAGKRVLKDTVASKAVKAVVPLVKGSVEGAAVQVTSNACEGKTWHAGLGKAIATGTVSSGVSAGVGKAGRSAAGSLKKGTTLPERSTGKSEASATKKNVGTVAGEKSAGKQVFKDTVASKAVKAAVPLVKGSVEGAAVQVTSNACERKDWHAGLGKAIATGAVSSGVSAGVGKAGRSVGGSKKGIPPSERTPKSKKQRAILGMAACARGGAGSAAGKVTANLCDSKAAFDDVGKVFAKGAVKSGTNASVGKLVRMRKSQSTKSSRRSTKKTNEQESEKQESNHQDSNGEESQLEESNFEESQPEESNFEESQLEESNFEESQLEESNFEESQLEESNFEESQLEESQFEESQFEESQYSEESQFVESQFEESKVEESQSEETQLKVSKFEES